MIKFLKALIEMTINVITFVHIVAFVFECKLSKVPLPLSCKVNKYSLQNKNWMLLCSLFCKQNQNGLIHLEKNNIHEDIFMFENIQAHVEPQPKQSAATKDCHLDFLYLTLPIWCLFFPPHLRPTTALLPLVYCLKRG